MSTTEFSITRDDVANFASVSLDDNPLHCDSEYASQTLFGRPVVHGILVVLKAIGLHEFASGTKIGQLDAEFLKPIFCHQQYQLSTARRGPRLVLRVLSGTRECLRLVITLRDTGTSRSTEGWNGAWGSEAVEDQDYSVDSALFAEFCEEVGIARKLSASQTRFLLFSSYYIGKIRPGKQALYRDLKVQFVNPENEHSKLDLVREELDPRFGLHTISCECESGGIKSATMRALARPDPVVIDAVQVEQVVSTLAPLPFRRVLVAGGSRGIGSALSLALAMSGANVTVCHRGNSDSLAMLLRQSQSIRSVPVDLNDEPEVLRKALFASPRVAYDLVVLCASPTIQEARFSEDGARDSMSKSCDYIRPSLNLLEVLLEELEADATVAHISSEFVTQPKPGFAVYAASKSFVESLLATLQLERPEIRFVNCRLPKVLTDQTNSNIDGKSLPRTESVIPTIWRALQAPRKPV